MGSGLYADMSDEALVAEIYNLRDSVRKVASRGIASVAGENRRVEFTAANINEARTELRNLLGEAARRGLSIADGMGGAIAVEIG